jgi:hypothetical protein
MNSPGVEMTGSKQVRVRETGQHKFRVGENLSWTAKSASYVGLDSSARNRGIVAVVAQLPPLAGVFQYRIKSAKESHEFMVTEHELSRVPQNPGKTL